ncbi:MAG TPA: hypothetical protein VIA18_27010 [Polyangia bacterium]|nr:hypothetical protein [Polyangia bacterium]
MKNLLLMTFASAALVGCTGAPAETGTPTAPAATTATTASANAATDADVVARQVLADVGAVIHGGDPGARYDLGEALPLHYVDATALRACGDHCTAETLLPAAVDRIYPVLLAGKVVASITLHLEDGRWQPSAIGQGGASGKLADARAQLRRARHADGDAYALVHVTGVNARFLAHREQSQLLLTSLAKGEPLAPRPGLEVLRDLATPAQ